MMKVFSQNIAMLVVLMSAGICLCGESAKAPYHVAPDAPLQATEKIVEKNHAHSKLRVEFNGINGDRVPAFLYVPKNGKSPRPAVLLQYGSGGSKNTNYIVLIGKLLAENGFAVLTIDSPNRGERRARKPKWSLLGPMDRPTFTQYCGDYSRAVDYLLHRKDVDANRIGYVGISMGAITGVTYVAHDERVKAMVSIVGGGWFLGLLAGRKSDDPKKNVPSLDPADHVGRIAPRPLLMVNAKKDQLVWQPFAKALHRNAGKGAKVIWMDTDHYFSGVDRKKLVETIIIRFLREKLPPIKSGVGNRKSGVQTAKATEGPLLGKKTYTYKTVGKLDINADVYRHDDSERRPVLVWIHGGALINGSRKSVPRQLLDLARNEKYVLVSLDYRLAPEVQLPDIVADIKDAFKWLHEKGPKLLGIDTKRIVVSGGSAGGYLTMGTGIWIKPRPKALVAYWGYGDVDGDWYTKPSQHYRKAVPLISKKEAYSGVGKRALSGVTDPAERKGRSRFYLYLRQNGLWTKEVTGFDPREKEKLDPFCPVRNITPKYPPILMVHGTIDTDVPYDLSANMAEELKRNNVSHMLVTVPNAGHGLSRGNRIINESAHAAALSFIRAHLRKK